MGHAEDLKQRLMAVTGLAGGPQAARLRDASGRVLEIGDEILVLSPKTIMRVAAITPVLHPGAPKGTVQLTLVTRLAIAAPSDSGIEDLYFLRHAAEIGDEKQWQEGGGAQGAGQPAGDGQDDELIKP